uniref:Uncharacterized protein n=1 Tax=Cannabis sativa TaxID=3483 RepID=A0A803PSZ1_CANSA
MRSSCCSWGLFPNGPSFSGRHLGRALPWSQGPVVQITGMFITSWPAVMARFVMPVEMAGLKRSIVFMGIPVVAGMLTSRFTVYGS